tara:strand:- start:733 stop:1374 length:642 start_codon:yes stop_codon:yes gene_type:complete
MVNIFNEVDEDIRKERYQSLWNKYGKYVISLIVLIIVIFSLSQYSKQKSIIDNKKILDIYYSAAEKIEINQYELANKSLEKVYNEKNKTLSALSGFKLTETLIQDNQKEKALLFLEEMYNNKSLEQIYRELALYKYIIINFENIQIKEIENIANSITTNKIILEPYFQEIFGIKLLTLGNIERANSIFTELSVNENTPFDLKVRLEKLIQIAS